ncbi:MAG: FlgD immunoglobulin-like domain containing protein [Candidatus Latescibacterota bacterium]
MQRIPWLLLVVALGSTTASAEEPFRCATAGTGPAPGTGVAAKPAQALTTGTRQALVLFGRFAGEEALPVPSWAAAIFDPALPGSFSHFYDTMSFGRLQVRGEVAPRRYASAQPVSAYLASDPSQEGDFGRFALELLRQADADLDFARFDNDGPDGIPDSGDDDGYVDAVFVLLQSTPARFLLREANGIASLGFDEPFDTADRGVAGAPIRIDPARGTVLQGRSWGSAVGPMCHEFGHLLGLIDLYDTEFLRLPDAPPEKDSAGVGNWCLMGRGAQGWRGDDGPVSFCAFSRLLLGWSEVVEVSQDQQELRLRDVGVGGAIAKVPVTGSEFFLIEHRRQSSFYDRNAPAGGVLIWHVHRQAPTPDQGARFRVDLESADGNWLDAGYPMGRVPAPEQGEDNLDFWAHDEAYTRAHQGNLGDATDPFDGARFTAFTPETNPWSVGVDGDLSVRVEGIRLEGEWAVAQVQTAPLLVEIRNLVPVGQDPDTLAMAGEEVRVRLTLANVGGLAARDLRVELHCDDPLVEIVKAKTAYGDLAPGRELFTTRDPLLAYRFRDGFFGARVARLSVFVYANGGLVAVHGFTATGVSPRLSLGEIMVVDTLGNADGGVQQGEIVRVGPILSIVDPALLRLFGFSVRSLQQGAVGLGGDHLRFDLSRHPVRPAEAPEFLVASGLPAGALLDFEFAVTSPFGTWRDTLALVVQPGGDPSAPRVLPLRTRADGQGVLFELPVSQVLESSAVTRVEAVVYAASDTTPVVTLPLGQRDAVWSATWAAPSPGEYLVRAFATDSQGNRAAGPLQRFRTFVDAPSSSVRPGGTGSWEAVDLPGLAAVPDAYELALATGDPEVLYLSSTRTGIWRTRDGGSSWVRVSPLTRKPALVDAADPDLIYTRSTAPLASSNGGASWEALADFNYLVLRADPLVSGRLFAARGAANQLAISEDGGRSWRDAPLGDIAWVEVHPVDPRILYAGPTPSPRARATVFYRSADHGHTWETRIVDRVFDAVVPDPGQPDGLYAATREEVWHSPDGGVTWESRSRLPADLGALVLAPHPLLPELLYAWAPGTYDRWWRSEDGGRTWEAIELPPNTALLGVVLHPRDPERLFTVTSGDGPAREIQPVQESRDRGRTWRPMSLVLPRGPQAGTVVYDARGGLYVGAAGIRETADPSQGVYRSRDGGLSWTWLGAAGSGELVPFADQLGIAALQVDPAEPTNLLAAYGTGFYRSSDAGRTWTRLSTWARQATVLPFYPQILSDLVEPVTQFLGVQGVARSADNARTWEQRSAGLPVIQGGGESLVSGLAFDAEGTGASSALYAAVRDTVWRSPDEGIGWVYAGRPAVDEPIGALAGHPARPGDLYAATSGGLYRSRDQGASWTCLLRTEPSPGLTGIPDRYQFVGISQGRPRVRFAPHDPERVYLVTGPELLESRDQGQTWRSIGTELGVFPWFNDVAVDPADPDVLFAATPWGVFRLARHQVTAVREEGRPLPAAILLRQNYPNPFNAQTVIPYRLPRRARVELALYDLAGQVIARLVEGEQEAGSHLVVWDGRDAQGHAVASGVYLCRLAVGTKVQTRRLVLVR